MKNFFSSLPFVLLTFGMVANNVIADDRFILGSFERITALSEPPYYGDNVSTESTLNGFSAKLYWFGSDEWYSAIGLGYTIGDVDVCVQSNCSSVGTTVSMFYAEIGRALGQWVPFVGGTWTRTVVEESEHLIWNSEHTLIFYPHSVVDRSADPFSLNIGFWRELDTLNTIKVRGALNIWDDSVIPGFSKGVWYEGEIPGVSGGVLFQMDNKFAVGAELEIRLDGEENRFRFSLQFGRSF